MTIRQIAKELSAQGYDIRYRVRKDGGVLITKINNQRFTGATGNKIARQMTGETISEARRSQLERITGERVDVQNLYKEYRRVKRKWTKWENKPKSAGELTFKKFKRALKEEGRAEALRYLGEKEKYATGIAYSRVLDAFVGSLKSAKIKLQGIYKMGADLLQDLIDDIEDNYEKIRDEWILPAYEAMYPLTKGQIAVTEEIVKDCINEARSILRL